MDKELIFKCLSFIKSSNNFLFLYQENLSLSYIHTKISLLPTIELVKQVEMFKNISLTSKLNDSSILIDDLDTPIKLIEYRNENRFYGKTILTNDGPSLKWLLEHMVEINNPNSNKVFYTNNMAIEFSKAKNSKDVYITILDMKIIENFINKLKKSYEKYQESDFITLLKNYGYTNAETIKSIFHIITVFQKAKKLGFKNPKKVTKHFCDKKLLADLILKDVFRKLTEYIY